jgi:hypothetical protein
MNRTEVSLTIVEYRRRVTQEQGIPEKMILPKVEKVRCTQNAMRGGGAVAVKTDPALWAAAKRRACTSAGLCRHSARKMQWATNDYKRRGGGYVGAKHPNNRLSRWSRQRWRTASGRKSGGRLRYLPDKAWRALSADEIRRTDQAKRKGFARGKQYVRQPRDVARKTRKFREDDARSRTSRRPPRRRARHKK